MSPALKNNLLKERAHALKEVRSFFDQRAVLEVDTPLLSKYAPIDTHIDLFDVYFSCDMNSMHHCHSSGDGSRWKMV